MQVWLLFCRTCRSFKTLTPAWSRCDGCVGSGGRLTYETYPQQGAVTVEVKGVVDVFLCDVPHPAAQRVGLTPVEANQIRRT